jgi:hypothetical protein
MQPCNLITSSFYMLSSTSLHTIYSNKSADAFSLSLLYIFIYCEEEEEKEVVLKERGRDGGY